MYCIEWKRSQEIDKNNNYQKKKKRKKKKQICEKENQYNFAKL